MSNRVPVITSAPVTLTNLEREYRYNATGFDPDGDVLIWALDEAPEGMVIDPQSGSIRWQPQAEQLGEFEIQVRLVDPLGSFVVQSYVLQVTGTNLPPVILSVPLTQGAVEQGYRYEVVAVDPEGDALRYQLGVSPEGMGIDGNGVISWVPTQTGRYRVEVVALDPQEAVGTQRYLLEVGDVALNQAPQITSLPLTLASAGEIYTYPVEATDPDEDELSYQLLNSPPGMDVDLDTGVIRWESPVAV